MQKAPWDCSYVKDPVLYMIVQWVVGVSSHAEIIKKIQCTSSHLSSNRYLQMVLVNDQCHSSWSFLYYESSQFLVLRITWEDWKQTNKQKTSGLSVEMSLTYCSDISVLKISSPDSSIQLELKGIFRDAHQPIPDPLNLKP